MQTAQTDAQAGSVCSFGINNLLGRFRTASPHGAGGPAGSPSDEGKSYSPDDSWELLEEVIPAAERLRRLEAFLTA